MFQSGFAILHSLYQCMKVPLASHSHQYLQSFYFRHSNRCEVVTQCGLMCISQIPNDVEHLSYCQFVYLVLWNDPSNLFPILTKFLSFYYWFVVTFYVSGYKYFIRYMYWKYFLSLYFTFSFSTCLMISRSFSFRQSLIHYIYFFLLMLVL